MASIELRASDGHTLSAYAAEPEGAPRGGIVVVQEIFGVNSHIRAVTDGFAHEGFLAIAPAIFDRKERGVELGYDAAGVARGREIAGSLDRTELLRDLAAAVDSVSGAGRRVGTVGYCFGGSVVWIAAAELPGITCVVSYYGSRIASLKDLAPAVPTMLHVGTKDASFPMDEVRDVGDRHPSVVIHEYDADHGFNCDQRGSWDEAAAKLALTRTLAFFRQHVGGPRNSWG